MSIQSYRLLDMVLGEISVLGPLFEDDSQLEVGAGLDLRPGVEAKHRLETLEGALGLRGVVAHEAVRQAQQRHVPGTRKERG